MTKDFKCGVCHKCNGKKKKCNGAGNKCNGGAQDIANKIDELVDEHKKNHENMPVIPDTGDTIDDFTKTKEQSDNLDAAEESSELVIISKSYSFMFWLVFAIMLIILILEYTGTKLLPNQVRYIFTIIIILLMAIASLMTIQNSNIKLLQGKYKYIGWSILAIVIVGVLSRFMNK